MVTLPLNQVDAIVGYWNAGVYLVSKRERTGMLEDVKEDKEDEGELNDKDSNEADDENGGEEEEKEQEKPKPTPENAAQRKLKKNKFEIIHRKIANHGIADIVRDKFNRFLYTRPDNYRLYITTNFKNSTKISRIKNMSDSKGRHLAMNRAKDLLCLRLTNQKVSVFECQKTGVNLVKNIDIEPFHGMVKDFCFDENNNLMILTPTGIVYRDTLESKDQTGVAKMPCRQEESDAEKLPQHNCMTYDYENQVLFVGKGVYSYKTESYKMDVDCYRIYNPSEDTTELLHVACHKFEEFKSKKLARFS